MHVVNYNIFFNVFSKRIVYNTPMATRLDHSREAKIDKRKQLEELGVNVHPYTFAVSHPISSAKESIGAHVTCAGRVMAIRQHGKVSFATLRDNSSEMQLMFRSDDLEKSYDTLNLIDTGDYLGVEGTVVETKTGEITIQVTSFSILSKSLRPLPSTWQGIGDPEVRYRKRYLDMIISPDVKRILDARFLIEKEIRRYLQDIQNFTEVETPVLQPLYGGTNAKPFTTHMNALDSDFYLRIAPELYLKRLIIGGYERIFEIARNFRNEGIDQTHQPEFTMMEWYEAYADYNRVMDVAEGMIKHLVQKLYGKGQLQVGEHTVNVEDTWPRITMKDAVKQHLHVDIDKATDEQLQEELETRHIQLTGTFSRGKAIFALFDKTVPEKLIQPTWIIDYPKEVSPLSKEHRSNKEFVERFECYIGGKEMCDGWSEITDALEQRKRFEVEQKHMREGDEEAQPTDEEFLEAMEYGMPPLGGIGIGIDRLVMFLTNVWSIKEVIAFPTLRPLKKQELIKKEAKVSQPVDKPKTNVRKNTQIPSRDQAEKLLNTYMKNESLLLHSHMVAQALEAYANLLGEDNDLWYITGLLHDLDWEAFPDEHPNKALTELLLEYPEELRVAIAEHAPHRTGVEPASLLGRYLFASDELSGLMRAASLMKPDGFKSMEISSIKKKIKDKAFARNVSREDIQKGFELIGKTPDEHITFLLEVFKK